MYVTHVTYIVTYIDGNTNLYRNGYRHYHNRWGLWKDRAASSRMGGGYTKLDCAEVTGSEIPRRLTVLHEIWAARSDARTFWAFLLHRACFFVA